MDICITTLGEFSVRRDGEPVKLPASKRTRALLAFLALTGRPHRRDRLCEIFWEIPDDPRAALRWSLTKIRPLVNDDECQRLCADRERVSLLTTDVDIDVSRLAQRIEFPGVTVDELIKLASGFSEPLLAGLDLPSQDAYQQWLEAERLAMDRLRGKVFQRLASHSDLSLDEQLPYLQSWSELEPFNPKIATQLITHLERLGRTLDVSQLTVNYVSRFRNAGIDWSPDARTPIGEDDKPQRKKMDGRELLSRQKIQFCTSSDGVHLAYASVGKGMPIVKAANWLSHLEHDWEAPIWSPLYRELAKNHHFIRYDERGNGLSDWDISDISFQSFVEDLEAVVDAAGLERFALMGISQGASVSIEYAVRHPERVTHLILFGGYATGWRHLADESLAREREAIMTLTASGWGQDNPAYRQIFSSTFMPSASPDVLAWFNEFQRLTTSPENAVRFMNVFADIDVRERLAEVSVPTLVMHSQGDQRVPVDIGRKLAASINGAEFIGLESDGHLLLGDEPASEVFVHSVNQFLMENPSITRYSLRSSPYIAQGLR